MLVWCLPSIAGFVLLLSAFAHQLQMGSKNYVTSPLIGIEILSILGILLVIPIGLVGIIILLIARRWLDAILLAINLVVAAVLLFAAFYIDSPTLLYAT